jgi:hypothetical protein
MLRSAKTTLIITSFLDPESLEVRGGGGDGDQVLRTLKGGKGLPMVVRRW